MNNQFIAAFIGAAIIIGGGAFYGGMHYAETKSAVIATQDSGYGANVGAGRMRSMRGGGMNDGFASGNIIALDDKSVTIALRSGGVGQGSSTQNTGTGSKIIFLSTGTQVMKTVDGSTKDLAVGDQITVTGTANADGSVTAASIQIRPTLPALAGQ